MGESFTIARSLARFAPSNEADPYVNHPGITGRVQCAFNLHVVGVSKKEAERRKERTPTLVAEQSGENVADVGSGRLPDSGDGVVP